MDGYSAEYRAIIKEKLEQLCTARERLLDTSIPTSLPRPPIFETTRLPSTTEFSSMTQPNIFSHYSSTSSLRSPTSPTIYMPSSQQNSDAEVKPVPQLKTLASRADSSIFESNDEQFDKQFDQLMTESLQHSSNKASKTYNPVPHFTQPVENRLWAPLGGASLTSQHSISSSGPGSASSNLVVRVKAEPDDSPRALSVHVKQESEEFHHFSLSSAWPESSSSSSHRVSTIWPTTISTADDWYPLPLSKSSKKQSAKAPAAQRRLSNHAKKTNRRIMNLKLLLKKADTLLEEAQAQKTAKNRAAIQEKADKLLAEAQAVKAAQNRAQAALEAKQGRTRAQKNGQEWAAAQKAFDKQMADKILTLAQTPKDTQERVEILTSQVIAARQKSFGEPHPPAKPSTQKSAPKPHPPAKLTTQKSAPKPYPPAKPTILKPSSSNLAGKSVAKEPIVEKVAADPLAECISELAGAWDDKYPEDNFIEYDFSSRTGSPEASSFGNELPEGVMDWKSTTKVMPVDIVKSVQSDPDANTQRPAKKPRLIMPASLARQGKVDDIDGRSENSMDDGELANVHQIPISSRSQLIKAREEALEKISSYLWNL
ncbi:hypothetical protein BGZ59_008645 [Podila verticillata]|nr:hypothetical protein BGZ59_008645 [Podila verticillata]